MAGQKENTRQKMINMMYLVFIAMLALNISKEVLGTLGILNEDISASNETLKSQIDIDYLKIEQNKDNPRYLAAYEQKENLQSLNSNLYNYLEGLKDILINSDENNFKTTVKFKNSKKDSTITDYQVMDKSQALDELFFENGIGPEGYTDSAREYILKYSSFSSKLFEILDNINLRNEENGVEPFAFEVIKEDIRKRFKFSEQVTNSDGTKQYFLKYHYEGFPLIASLSKFTNIQSNIRAVENRILKAITEGIKIDETNINETNYKTNLYSDKSSHYVNNIVDAKIVLGRNDDNFQPSRVELFVDDVKLNEDEYKRERGGVVLNKSFRIPKKYKLTGNLFFDQDGEERQVSVNQSFDVINKPNSAIVSLDAERTMYRGLRNPVTITFPGVSNESSIRVNAQGAELKRVSGLTYNVFPLQNAKKVVITVSGNINGETVTDRTGNIFDVEDGPAALGSLRVVDGGETFLYCDDDDEGCTFEIPKFDLIDGLVQGVKPKFFKYNYSIDVRRFSVKVGNLPETQINGNRISSNEDVKRYISNANSGDIVIIKIIDAVKNDAGVISDQKVKQFRVQIQ